MAELVTAQSVPNLDNRGCVGLGPLQPERIADGVVVAERIVLPAAALIRRRAIERLERAVLAPRERRAVAFARVVQPAARIGRRLLRHQLTGVGAP